MRAILRVWHSLYATAAARDLVALALRFPHRTCVRVSPEALARATMRHFRDAGTFSEVSRAVELLTYGREKCARINTASPATDYEPHWLL
ncbi:hypothetical protein GCM10025864_11000 [Luteimicrobium album]|uniref:Uncharacterized protein n=1 Tax=Luteimicrobium album TaxID=1054550 RepID=A0ABQ6HZ93_9MICO|nr:hypothetical protein GCM10025864_11000 [Luteimicrobium album]